jgi:pimeloyl-ACP methyl ester carboxylesterase
MSSTAQLLPSRLNRRAALRSAGAIAAVLGLGGRIGRTTAQDATPQPSLAPVGQTATINGAALYYEVIGPADGQPVLLLHGGMGNAEWWVNLSPVLVAAGYRVVAMDSRGHGRSAWGDVPITYEQMTADTLGLLDELGIEKTDVVGWSDGAIIGLELAINHPERLDRVVAYGANYTPEGVHDLVPSDQLPPFERLIADYQRLSPQPERFDELFEELNALYEIAPNFSEEQLKSITVPVLVLDGAEEEFIKPEHTARLAELIPGAELVIMPGTGHFAPFAQPAVFNQIVLEFLAGEAIATPTS